MMNMDQHADHIAIVGMAGQFPGAKDIGEFWRNLLAGVESITFFSDEELIEAGLNIETLRDPNYVKAAPMLEDVEWFDAPFFGFTPREAEIRDPQHRVFLETAHQALEHAGYDSARYDGAIGVYAGAYTNRYAWLNVHSNPAVRDAAGIMAVEISNHRDYLSTLVSYKLNLRGPSLTVATACSTSLVAVHLACQSLRFGECDMALAGGVEVEIPKGVGYWCAEGGIFSPDGHCRAFDARANGTIFGSGVGVVVLKRFPDAWAAGDHIYALIRGSAINNDGSRKVGFTAPGIDGQAQVIAEAYGVAGVDPATVSFIEAHGTGTLIGDPIEVAALAQVFRASTSVKQFCALGSVKPNIGHLGPAAGVAGLIKTVLAFHHQQLPPNLHFEQPNPAIDFANSPFFVNTAPLPWRAGVSPRRAGVSSFGIGGTNAHAVLEEAVPSEPSGPSRPWQLVLLSAKTSSALETASDRLATHMRTERELNLADAAYTLQVGRGSFSHRRMLVCQSAEEAAGALESRDPERVLTGTQPGYQSVAYLFPGQGAQHIGMAHDLFLTEGTFRQHVDHCAKHLLAALGIDLRELLWPPADRADAAARHLDQTFLTQPALFTVEYALARLWMEWGIHPQAMLGHSIGEYVAACLAGVFSLEEALDLVALRGQLMQSLPPGAMLAIPLSEEQARPVVGDRLALAAVNSPGSCVLAGPTDAVQELEKVLTERGVTSFRLRTSHAFHSQMMDPILEPFARRVEQVARGIPQIPFISNVTATWITARQAADPEYWATHLRHTVRFAEGLRELCHEDRVLLEVGPGQTLTSLARQGVPRREGTSLVLSSLPHSRHEGSDAAHLLTTLGRLWLTGSVIDWEGYYSRERRCRVALPTYPFERRRYWVDPSAQPFAAEPRPTGERRLAIDQAFFRPVWKESPPLFAPPAAAHSDGRSPWLVFADDCGVGTRLVARLRQEGHDVSCVQAGARFVEVGEHDYIINPQNRDEYDALIGALALRGALPRTVVHMWSVTWRVPDPFDLELSRACQTLGFYSVLFTAQSVAKAPDLGSLRYFVISTDVHNISGEGVEQIIPAKATVLGPCRVLPKELRDTTCRNIDFVLPRDNSAIERLVLDPLVTELNSDALEPLVAYRGTKRWTWSFDNVHIGDTRQYATQPRQFGVYLITGGLGGIGLVLAEDLARVQARLILLGRSAFPSREQWEGWLLDYGQHDRVSQQITQLQRLESMGAEVLVIQADVTDRDQMREALARATNRFGPINGVIHAAGVASGGMAVVKEPSAAAQVLRPKVEGTLVLRSLLADTCLDFFVLCSSITSTSGDYGLVDYVAANAFLDAFAQSQASCQPFTVSVNWPAWLEVGMAVATHDPLRAFRGLQGGGPQYQECGHPLLDARVFEMGMTATDIQYVTKFSPSSHWILDEHRIQGHAILPGTAYLELARAAFSEAVGGESVELRDVVFLAPLWVGDGEQREVRTQLKRDAEGSEFSVVSRSGAFDRWQTHAVGNLRSVSQTSLPTHDLRAIKRRCNLREVAEPGHGEQGLVSVGPHWSTIQHVSVGQNEQLALLELPKAFRAEVLSHALHPALLDGATAFGQAATLRDGHYLPFGYGRVTVRSALPARFYSHIKQHCDGSGEDIITCDIVLMNEDGVELVDIEGFVLRRVEEQAFLDPLGRRTEEPTEQSPGPGENAGSGHSPTTNDDVRFGILPAEGVKALRSILSARLGPQIIVCVEGLQRKIDRTAGVTQARIEKELADRETPGALAQRTVSNPYIAPVAGLEKSLADLWQEALGIEIIGAEDNFFELGGNSLVAVQLASRVRGRFQIGLPIAALFESMTIRRLARVIEEALVQKAEALSEEEAQALLAATAKTPQLHK
jgi:phthiocerol/phenolphthiocerol synthesis type-I polyketide synthase E